MEECKGGAEGKEEIMGDDDGDPITLYVTVHTHGDSSTVPLRFKRRDNFVEARACISCVVENDRSRACFNGTFFVETSMPCHCLSESGGAALVESQPPKKVHPIFAGQITFLLL